MWSFYFENSMWRNYYRNWNKNKFIKTYILGPAKGEHIDDSPNKRIHKSTNLRNERTKISYHFVIEKYSFNDLLSSWKILVFIWTKNIKRGLNTQFDIIKWLYFILLTILEANSRHTVQKLGVIFDKLLSTFSTFPHS